MAMSSTKNLLTPFEEPKQVLHSSRKLFKTLSLDYSSLPEFDLFFDYKVQCEEEVAEAMVEPTTEEYMTFTCSNYDWRIIEKGKIELKGKFLIELDNNAFSVTNGKDTIEHIENFLKILQASGGKMSPLVQLLLGGDLMKYYPPSRTGRKIEVNENNTKVKRVTVAKKIKELIKKDELTIADLEGAGLEMLKRQYKNYIELEYHVDQLKAAVLEEAQWSDGDNDLSNKKVHLYQVNALNGIHHWDDMQKDFFKAEMGNRSIHKVYSDKRIITIVSVDVKKKRGYSFLTSIKVNRTDNKEYEFSYANLSRLSLNDIEDMYLVKVQGKLHHLKLEFEIDFINSLILYIKRVVIKNRIKDTHLDKNDLRLRVFSKSLIGDAETWWNNEIEGTTIGWNEMFNKFSRKYYPLSHSKVPDDLDNGTDYLEFLYRLALKFDNYWEIDKNTQNGLWEFYVNEHREYSPIPVPARRDINNPDKLCKTEEFTIIRYLIGLDEEFVAVEPSKISIMERTPGSTDISKITRKPSKTGKHGHEKWKSTIEAKDAKPKPEKVKTKGFSKLKVKDDNSRARLHNGRVNYVKSRALIDHLSIKATWLWKKAQGEVGFTLGSLREVAQAVTSRMTAWQSLSVHT
ncbi:hypothetical protein Tco_0566132 [Tanacetum coccineum]